MDNQDSDLIPIGLFVRDAALREHPDVPGDNDLRADIRKALRETTEKDFLLRLGAYLEQGKLRAVNPLNGAPYDPDIPGMDSTDPMWSLAPSEQENAWELLGQLVRLNGAGYGQVTLQASGKHAAEVEARSARQARGFFTLREAAQKLARAHSLNEAKLLRQLIDAFDQKLLVVRDPDTEAPVAGRRVRDFHDWVSIDDLNELFSNVWRVSYRFTPPGAAAPSQQPTPVAETTDQRCARLLGWLREEEAKQARGALARVVRRDGRARQTVSADIARAKRLETAEANPMAAMARAIGK